MTVQNVIEKLQELAPKEYAMDWDNVGLLAGRMDKEVKKIFVALEVTDETLEEALAFGADLIITHHPLLFSPIRSVTDQDIFGSRLIAMIQADMSYYAMHTNFDIAPEGMADLAAQRLGLICDAPLMVTAEDGNGIGRIGRLLQGSVSIQELAERVKECFHLPFVTVHGDLEKNKIAEKIAISPGSGESMVSDAIRAGADVLISGDIRHHQGLDAGAMGLPIIDAGHYGLEYIFISFMEEYLKKQFGSDIEVGTAVTCFPIYVM